MRNVTQQPSVRGAPVPAFAGVHGRRRSHAGTRDWRNYSHIHAHPCRNASVAAGRGSRAALPHRRRRRLLCRRGTTGSLGDVFVSPLRAVERRNAGVRAGGRVPGRRGAPERETRGRRQGGKAATRRVRDRELLHDARRRRVRRPCPGRRRRPAVRGAGGGDQPSYLAGTYGGDTTVVGSSFVLDGPSVHDRWRRPAWIFRRNAREQSSRSLDPGSPGAAHQRRRDRCSGSRCRRGCASSGGCGRAPRPTAWRRV